MGRCPDCSQWNSLVEEAVTAQPHARGDGDAGPARAPSPIHAVTTDTDSRMRSGIEEFDRVLGGGLVDGSAVLIGGDPGIGKSTLLLQAVAALSHDGPPCLYVSGEESEQQVKMRGQRISLASSNLLVLSETSLERILEQVRAVKPAVLVVDSIQTVHTSAIPSAPGSIGQVRECSSALISLAKKSGIGTFLVGHVTKDGAIAGPRILEHMVDTVLYFEGERGHSFRILRAVKNRFGSTNEIGVFEMQEAGLRGGSGSVVVPSMEGTRPILVEIQTLVTRSFLTLPRRTCIGVESNRVALILAILEKRKGMNFYDKDVFINVAGGVSVSEPAVDLGIAVGLASSALDRPVDPYTIFVGEVGLAGEIRTVSRAEARVAEAGKLGFRKCVLPQGNCRQLPHVTHPELVGVASLDQCWENIW
ncbi:DNA repair protein RadA [Geodia barretti]|uniref:DNA repair protein RadA n=1 Tax=Geodia barretti TaxID=519541 RepID=A0AA35R9J4_GEOBA|nr:DNA repair protein RadA [Geodia barretti]